MSSTRPKEDIASTTDTTWNDAVAYVHTNRCSVNQVIKVNLVQSTFDLYVIIQSNMNICAELKTLDVQQKIRLLVANPSHISVTISEVTKKNELKKRVLDFLF